MKKIITIFSSVLFVTMFSQVQAVTSEEEKPKPNEGACDHLIGATPSLYGLCVAFVEAQDCQPNLQNEDPIAHCQPSSRKLLELYNKRKSASDPEMPGFSIPCPCLSSEDMAGFPTATSFIQCSITGQQTNLRASDLFGKDYVSTSIWNGSNSDGICVHSSYDLNGDPVSRMIRLWSEEEYQACASIILSKINELGLTCYDK